MNLREELRGVRRVDLACAVLMVPIAIWTGTTLLAPDAPETQVQEVQVQVMPRDEYKAVWDWCGVRFPFREDLQEACRWGAHEMLPGQDAPADERTQDA